MELLAGAFSRSDVTIVNNLIKIAHARNKIITPTQLDYIDCGKILARLQTEKGYDLKKAITLQTMCWSHWVLDASAPHYLLKIKEILKQSKNIGILHSKFFNISDNLLYLPN